MSNITIKKILWDKELTNSRLEFNIKGEDINNVIVNTLRRIVTTFVPIYSFSDIKISFNTSIFNNNYLKLRLNNLPVIGIKTEKSIFVNKDEDEDEDQNVIIENNDNLIDNSDDISLDIENNVNISSINQLTMYLEYENKTDNIVSIGTDSCKFYLKEKQIESPYPQDIQIIKLQPNQKIKISAITKLGIEEQSGIFSPVSICTFKHNTDNDYDFILESRGQLNELEILDIVNDNIQNLLDNLINKLPDEKDLHSKLVLQKFDHTLACILTEGLQKHKDVIYAGYSMPHPLDNKIIIEYKLSKGNFKNISIDILNNYKKIFNDLNNKLQKI